MKKLVALFLAAMLLLSGCGAKSIDRFTQNDNAMATTSGAAGGEFEMDNGGSNPVTADTSRKWVITVNMWAEAEDMDEAMATIDERIAAAGGYVESQEIENGSAYNQQRRYRETNMVVRIPADKVDVFLADVRGATNVTSSSTNKEDITLQYYATETRIKALRAEEERLLEMMKEAKSLTELLEVEDRLTDVRYELEVNESKHLLMDNQVNYATVRLHLSEVREYSPQEDATFWEKIRDGFVGNVKALGAFMSSFVIWFISSLPTILVLAAAVCLVIWLRRMYWRRHPDRKPVRYRDRRKQGQENPRETPKTETE